MVTFRSAERLRNLGRFAVAEVAAFRCVQTSVRVFAASGTLVTVALYPIVQMVGAGQLIKLLFFLDCACAVGIVGMLMMADGCCTAPPKPSAVHWATCMRPWNCWTSPAWTQSRANALAPPFATRSARLHGA